MAPGASLITKLKVQLKLTIARLRMVQQRDEQLGKTARRAMAQLLEAGKEDSARIRVENIIRSDITSELHEMLELYCELLLARAGLMEGHTVDPGLEEAIQSLIYAAPKTEIKELATVRTLFAEKYGKDYVLAATENTDGKVSEKVVKKLSVTPPREELVVGYLEEIARAYGVDWPKREAVSPPPELLDDDDDDDDDQGGQKQKVLETPLAADSKDPVLNTPVKKLAGGGPTSPLTVTPPRMTTDNIHPKVTLGSVELKPSKKAEPAARKGEPDGSIPDLGDLERRFAALKKR
ncbi:Vacuolar protein sorting-associated protein ist1 [Fusarium oxysporum]|nr:Vacuolar protein sorting-associated protein ist1 [Fusarium oxysporum]KAJ4058061.1 Vacuolar protein sorting-associated protein ist1 [Fusarium oxysporum]KAJ4068738.1 Vacuolar protein sorting-associated protein ist1 [Fusarium oxysporum]KAJ4081573.1 Vacuolar protein sorting-associated protein ist1 [Fusarium oxysporum]KAJ4096713.1 Vacuolar protein sorting-associated protein ist1 [Fusarium oxysporum]